MSRILIKIGSTLFVVLCLSLVTVAYAEDDEGQNEEQGVTVENQSQAPPPGGFLKAKPQPLPGPKRTVVVAPFTGTTAFKQKFGDWDLGGGLAAMLTSALVESGQFIVADRVNIQQIFSEQQMIATGLSRPGTGPSLGQITGGQLLIRGNLSEFQTDVEGGGANAAVSVGVLGDIVDNIFGSVGVETSTGVVGMDIHVIDMTTSTVLKSITVKKEAEGTGVDFQVGYSGIGLGANRFWKTPLGEATREAINESVLEIAEEAKNKPWRGWIAEVDGATTFITAGTRSGIKVGDKFMIHREVKRINNPVTGELLTIKTEELGLVQIEDLQEKIAWGPFKPLGLSGPQIGDIVVEAK